MTHTSPDDHKFQLKIREFKLKVRARSLEVHRISARHPATPELVFLPRDSARFPIGKIFPHRSPPPQDAASPSIPAMDRATPTCLPQSAP